MTTWGQQARRHWARGWRVARQGGERVRRLAAQGAQQARKAGVMTARKVISVQRAAGMDKFGKGRDMMALSARGAIGEIKLSGLERLVPPRRGPAPDADWAAGYRAVAEAEDILAAASSGPLVTAQPEAEADSAPQSAAPDEPARYPPLSVPPRGPGEELLIKLKADGAEAGDPAPDPAAEAEMEAGQ